MHAREIGGRWHLVDLIRHQHKAVGGAEADALDHVVVRQAVARRVAGVDDDEGARLDTLCLGGGQLA